MFFSIYTCSFLVADMTCKHIVMLLVVVVVKERPHLSLPDFIRDVDVSGSKTQTATMLDTLLVFQSLDVKETFAVDPM